MESSRAGPNKDVEVGSTRSILRRSKRLQRSLNIGNIWLRSEVSQNSETKQQMMMN
jgi:hypothetical protein